MNDEERTFNLATVDMAITDIETGDKFIKPVNAASAAMRSVLATDKCEGNYGVIGTGKLSKSDKLREQLEFRLTPFDDKS